MQMESWLHPAAEWAAQTEFTTTDVDCTITVVLKILDGKCKMLPGEKAAIFEIYDVVRGDESFIFDYDVRRVIDQARQQDATVMDRIHELRVFAEASIPKPVMKKYKAMLRDGLFG